MYEIITFTIFGGKDNKERYKTGVFRYIKNTIAPIFLYIITFS